MKFRDYGKKSSHRKSEFEQRFDTPYEMQKGKGDDFPAFALVNNAAMTNAELLSVLAPTIHTLRQMLRQSGELSSKDVVVLRLYEALKTTEEAFQGTGEDYDEIATKFYEAIRHSELEGQPETLHFMRSVLAKIAHHGCDCAYCVANRELALQSLHFLAEVERATGGEMSAKHLGYRRGDGTEINSPKRAGSMFLAG